MRYQYLFIFFLTLLIFTSSCTSIKGSIGGNYLARWGTNGFYYLRIDDSDSTFEYESNAMHKGKYNGFWEISEDSIYLHFPKSNNPIHILTAHNLHNQIWRLKINKRSLFFPYLKIKFRKINKQQILKWRNNSKKRYTYSYEGTHICIRREAKVGTVSSFHSYSGSRIFEGNALEYSYFPGGYFDAAGAAHYTHTDYQGSIIAVTDSTGKVVQKVDYYPYGEPFREPAGQPMLFSGKERTTLADYRFDPRNYNPAGIYWSAPDLKAYDYTAFSPYSFCAANPIDNIELNGMDYYELDGEGRLVLRIDDEEYDYIGVNAGGSYIESEKYKKGTIEDHITVSTPVVDADDGTAQIFKVRGDENANELFEFLADNVNAEYTKISVGIEGTGPSFISTSYAETTEVGGFAIFDGQLKYGYTIRSHTHSHPHGNSKVSPTDEKTRDKMRATTKQNIQFYQYNPAIKVYTTY